MERVTGIEPAWPAWKISGWRAHDEHDSAPSRTHRPGVRGGPHACEAGGHPLPGGGTLASGGRVSRVETGSWTRDAGRAGDESCTPVLDPCVGDLGVDGAGFRRADGVRSVADAQDAPVLASVKAGVMVAPLAIFAEAAVWFGGQARRLGARGLGASDPVRPGRDLLPGRLRMGSKAAWESLSCTRRRRRGVRWPCWPWPSGVASKVRGGLGYGMAGLGRCGGPV